MKKQKQSISIAKSPRVVSDITAAKYNPRTITPEQLEVLGRAMAEFGDLGGIVFNTRTQNTVGGHQRVKQLDPSWKIEKQPHKDKTGTIALGHIETDWGRFSYREVDWPIEKEQAANLAANKIGGEFDFPAVGQLINDIGSKFDLSLTGFSSDEMSDLLKNIGTATTAVETPFSDFDDTESGTVAFKFGEFLTQVDKDVYDKFKKYADKKKKEDPETLIGDIIDSLL